MARRKDGCFHNQENRGTSKRVPPQKHVGGTSSLTEPGEPYGDLTGKVGLDPRPRVGVQFLCSLQNALHIRFRHRLSNLPVDHRPTRTIQKRAQVVERPVQIQVRDIRMPVLVRSQRLNEARSLLRRLPFQRSRRPAFDNTRYVVDGLKATTSSSSIMNVSRRYPSSGWQSK